MQMPGIGHPRDWKEPLPVVFRQYPGSDQTTRIFKMEVVSPKSNVRRGGRK
jgi:hypothetical protein